MFQSIASPSKPLLSGSNVRKLTYGFDRKVRLLANLFPSYTSKVVASEECALGSVHVRQSSLNFRHTDVDVFFGGQHDPIAFAFGDALSSLQVSRNLMTRRTPVRMGSDRIGPFSLYQQHGI